MSRDLEPDDFFAIRDQFFLVVDALTTKVARLIVKRQDLIKQTPRPNAEIKELKTDEEKEAAHQRNRRTDFKILRQDYVPKEDPNAIKGPKVEDASDDE
jgi:hypothetical protein